MPERWYPVNLQELSEKYELNGAAILNVIHYAFLKSVPKNDNNVHYADLIEAIRKEVRKKIKP